MQQVKGMLTNCLMRVKILNIPLDRRGWSGFNCMAHQQAVIYFAQTPDETTHFLFEVFWVYEALLIV